MAPIRLEVHAATGVYPVEIAPDALARLPALLAQVAPNAPVFLVSSAPVWERHAPLFAEVTAAHGEAVLVPDGERAKHLGTVNRVYEALIQRGADRSALIVAVGGGVIGDLVGFAAATYLRGVRFVQVPTTLLAQVDSAVGGKVGVNHALGKNLIGAFHPPVLVLADPRVLATLPRREFRAGLYEVIKYGVIDEPALLERTEALLPMLFKRAPEPLVEIVAACCRIKARIVGADERESGLRRMLNFGHTAGHAIEAVTKYRRFRHGEAVALGMLVALAIGVERGLTDPSARARVTGLITKLGPLPSAADLSGKGIIAAIRRDKKVLGGTLHFVAVSRLGETAELRDVTEDELTRALRSIGVQGG